MDNLSSRLACFVPSYSSLLVNSDVHGTTNATDVHNFKDTALCHGRNIIINSTFLSAQKILSEIDSWDEKTLILVDEVHNIPGFPALCSWIQELPSVLIMSATLPDEIHEDLRIEHVSKVPFSKGIDSGYIVDYATWLPVLTTNNDGRSSIEATVPLELGNEFDQTITPKVLYHARCMMLTGSRRAIVYLQSKDECYVYMECFRRVLEDYHGINELWMGKIACDVDSHQRSSILNQEVFAY